MEWVLLWRAVKEYWWILAAVLGVIAVLLWKADFANDNQEIGAVRERTASLEGVIADVQTANSARAEARDPGSVTKYCQCLQSSRTPDSCTRYLPARYTYNDQQPPGCDKPN